MHKMSKGNEVEELPIRPIIFNLDIATYGLVKHLAKLSSSLGSLEYKTTKVFIEKLKYLWYIKCHLLM